MLKGANARTFKVVASSRTGVASSLNKCDSQDVDFASFHKHQHNKVKFFHPSNWLTGSTSGIVEKPKSTLLSPALTMGLSSYSVRHAHTDMKAPDFSHYRHRDGQDPTSTDRMEARKTTAYATSGACLMGLGMMAKGILHPIVQQWAPAADVLALAKVEVNIAEIAPGTNKTIKWRGKPLFVRRRTEAETEAAQNVDMSSLKDPQDDKDRTKDPEWLVVLGVCTHLGCVPISHAGAFNGYYCPCHGSHYDTSGRIRQGPAPLNLEVPEYVFEGDKLVVG